MRVLDLLGECGYTAIPQPLEVGGIPFAFAAMLMAPTALDLIVVIDTVTESEESRVRERIEGLARTMDVVGSRRALTVVIIGPHPGLTLWNALSKVARVLMVGVDDGADGEKALRDSLAVLLPLPLSSDNDEAPESWATVREALMKTHTGPETEVLIRSAGSGPACVEQELRTILLNALEQH